MKRNRTAYGCCVALVVAVFGALYWFSSLFPEPSRDEIARVSSPRGTIDAVLVETNGGATTAFGYEVYVVPKGQRWGGDRKALVYYPEGDVRLQWASLSTLQVVYKDARFADLFSKSFDVNGEQVQIKMRTKNPE